MEDHTAFDQRLENIGAQLDQLAARATRAVAELRGQSRSIVDDIEAWKQHLDEFRIDAEIARMDARDTLGEARRVCRERSTRIEQRLEEFREESTSAWRSIRGAMDEALQELRETVKTVAPTGA